MTRFNYAAFRDGFRAACARRGIDPERGASVYDVVKYNAEQRKAAYIENQDQWWRDFDQWTFAPPHRSSTEALALFHLFEITYGMALTRLWSAQYTQLREQVSAEAEERARIISRITTLIDRLLDEMGDKLDDAKLSELARALSILLDNRRALAGDDDLVELEDVHEKLAGLLDRAARGTAADDPSDA